MNEVTYTFLQEHSGVCVHFDGQILVFSSAEFATNLDRRTRAIARTLLKDAIKELDELGDR